MRLGEEGEPEAAEAIGFYAELIGWLHRHCCANRVMAEDSLPADGLIPRLP